MKTLSTLFLSAAMLLSIQQPASAQQEKPNYLSNWQSLYPGSTTDDAVISATGSSCQLCHEDSGGGDGWNAYGWQQRLIWSGGGGITNAISQSEPFDSDADPTASTNLAEILADAQPGWTAGPNNTIFFKNGSTQTNQMPPSGLGNLDPTCPAAVVYCTAGATSNGCTASMGSSGTPSLSNAGPFTLLCSNVEGNKNGIFFYSIAGRNAAPWGNSTSFLCVKAPTQRMNPPTSSGGTGGSCNGSYAADWNAYVAANPLKAINQALVVGSTVGAQAWFRDPAAGTGPVGSKGTALSDALEFTVCP